MCKMNFPIESGFTLVILLFYWNFPCLKRYEYFPIICLFLQDFRPITHLLAQYDYMSAMLGVL